MSPEELTKAIEQWYEHGLPATGRETLIDYLVADRERSRKAMGHMREHVLHLLHQAKGFPISERHDTAVALHRVAVALDDPVEVEGGK